MIGVAAGVGALLTAAAAYCYWRRHKHASPAQQGKQPAHNDNQASRKNIAGAFDSVVVAKKRKGLPLGNASAMGEL